MARGPGPRIRSFGSVRPRDGRLDRDLQRHRPGRRPDDRPADVRRDPVGHSRRGARPVGPVRRSHADLRRRSRADPVCGDRWLADARCLSPDPVGAEPRAAIGCRSVARVSGRVRGSLGLGAAGRGSRPGRYHPSGRCVGVDRRRGAVARARRMTTARGPAVASNVGCSIAGRGTAVRAGSEP